MRRQSLRIALGIATLIGLTAVSTSPVAAECMPRPASGEPIDRQFAFTTTVRSVRTEPDPDPGLVGAASGVQWRVTLDVVTVYGKDVPSSLTLRGTTHDGSIGSGCSYLLGDHLAANDVLFVALDQQLPIATNETLFGNLLLWRQEANGWRFYESALQDGNDSLAYPSIARDARTTAQILSLLGLLPDTSNGPSASVPDAPSNPWLEIALLITAVVAFTLTFRRLGARAG